MQLQFEIKQKSTLNSKMRPILMNSYIQFMILALQGYQFTQQKLSLQKIRYVRLNPNKKKQSKVQQMFLMKKIFDILKYNLIREKKRYHNVRENYIKFNAYLVIFSNWKRKKEIKQSCKTIIMWVQKQYIKQLFKAQINIKDLFFQKSAIETLRHNKKNTFIQEDKKTVKQKVQTSIQEKLQPVQPFSITPNKELNTPPRLFKPGMVAFFYGSSAKTQCDMAKFDI